MDITVRDVLLETPGFKVYIMLQTSLGGLFYILGMGGADEKIKKAYTIMKLEAIAHVID